MKIPKVILASILLACIILPVHLHAQNWSESFYSPPPLPDVPNDVPIDGGLGFLIAGGVLFGAKKIRDHRKKSEVSE